MVGDSVAMGMHPSLVDVGDVRYMDEKSGGIF